MQRSPGTDRLHRLLGGPHTVWLVERMRRRLELGKPLTGTVTLFSASVEQRRAVELLLGRRPGSGVSLSVSLDELDRTLRASRAAPDGLAAAVEQLAGPVRNRSAEAASVAAAWATAFRELEATLADRPELAEWRAWLDTTGVVRRLVADPKAARLVLDAVAGVVQRLPSTGVPLGRLAAEVCGDAHALDEGRPVATLALSAARAMAIDSLPGEALTSRREIWAAVGVHLDELSSTVLCLGLPGDSLTPLGRILAAMRAAGEPSVLTLRQLRRHDGPVLAGDGLVRLCENPVVVAAAAEELGGILSAARVRQRPAVCRGVASARPAGIGRRTVRVSRRLRLGWGGDRRRGVREGGMGAVAVRRSGVRGRGGLVSARTGRSAG